MTGAVRVNQIETACLNKPMKKTLDLETLVATLLDPLPPWELLYYHFAITY